ncbi:hypothetical protein MHPYR_20023 [uncultured Mycobacterium sp.]|uniref:Uncharacterized protein n=1 Tax=uncultured Mycobacterium sp. TaxID=171292 RepID=A0A1Y5P6V2_9MYCO|nr:hypothetical protein MHPYR_20023 [uncultured Mycobacterium sp.]
MLESIVRVGNRLSYIVTRHVGVGSRQAVHHLLDQHKFTYVSHMINSGPWDQPRQFDVHHGAGSLR